MLPVGLQRDCCDHIVQHRGDHIFFFGRGQRAFQDLRIVQHIVNLVGQALSRQLYGRHIRADLWGKLLRQGYLADTDHHIDRRAKLMGCIG